MGRRLLFRRDVERGVPVFVCLGVLLLSQQALGAYYHVAPDGAGQDCSHAVPCALGTGAERAGPGDTVLLHDGTYAQGLFPQRSGTPEAWITFQAEDCALPILEGQGEAAPQDDSGNTPSGVYMNQATYLRFVGIVSRYWDSGFTNGWTGDATESSNGHIEYINCIGDGNSRTAFAMYSARGLTIRECIAAHSGGSTTHSWSSGVQLYAVQGTPAENVVERTVSFENADEQKGSDGSGFIADESTTGATFRNVIGFRNGGSCLRITRSENVHMSHFSCYHNGQNPDAGSPTNPGEIFWNDDKSRVATSLVSSLLAASGSPTDPTALRLPPSSGLSNNLLVNSGPTPFFTDPAGPSPDFRPPEAAAAQVENLGLADGAPDVDIGFDPRCIVQANPNVPYQQPWWEYSIDYEYIRSIGGVAGCFHPKARTGGPDIGAYELSGAPHEFSTPGTCVPSTYPDPPPPPLGSGGAVGSGGSGPGGGSGGADGGGVGGTAGTGAQSGSGGATPGGRGCSLGSRPPRSLGSSELGLGLALGVLAFRRRRAAA